jgi:branched-subunit amino acid ABC-type transport system permease component
VVVQILNGASAIAILLLLASGIAIIFGVLRVINFAHGEMVMLGGYGAVLTHWLGLNPWLSLLVAPLVVGGIGLLIERVIIRPLSRRPLDTILATIALSIVLRKSVEALFSPQFKYVPYLTKQTITIGSQEYPAIRLVVIGIALALTIVMVFIEKGTRFGLKARAVIANPSLAAVLGVNVSHVYTVTFVIGAALAGFAGAIIAGSGFSTVYPGMGFDVVVQSFLTVLVGGVGSVPGLAASAVSLGAVKSIADLFSNTVYSNVAMLVVAALILRILPHGLGQRR